MTGSPIRLVFAGTPEFAATALAALLDDGRRPLAVYTQPDRPAGRGRTPQPSAVKRLASAHELPVRQPIDFRDPAAVDALRRLEPDLMVVVAYGLLLPPSVLAAPRLGAINVHASLLPRWRGAAPIQRAILAGDKETGISIMQITERLDSGPVLLQRTCPIGEADSAGDLHDRLAELGAKALLEGLTRIAAGNARFREQDEGQATYAPKIQKAEAALDWSLPAEDLARRVRAFNPRPVAHAWVAGEALRIWRAIALMQPAEAPPGTVLAAGRKGIDVATGRGRLRLLEIQAAGRRPVSAGDYANAHPGLSARPG